MSDIEEEETNNEESENEGDNGGENYLVLYVTILRLRTSIESSLRSKVWFSNHFILGIIISLVSCFYTQRVSFLYGLFAYNG